jgi:hypothetical protein
MSMRKLLPLAALLLPSVVLAAPRTFEELANQMAGLIDNATFVLIAFGLVVYFWGLAVNIPHFGDEKGAEKVRAYFFWGIIVLTVMLSIWGIVQILQNTLFGSSEFNPTTGEVGIFTFCDDFDCE